MVLCGWNYLGAATADVLADESANLMLIQENDQTRGVSGHATFAKTETSLDR